MHRPLVACSFFHCCVFCCGFAATTSLRRCFFFRLCLFWPSFLVHSLGSPIRFECCDVPDLCCSGSLYVGGGGPSFLSRLRSVVSSRLLCSQQLYPGPASPDSTFKHVWPSQSGVACPTNSSAPLYVHLSPCFCLSLLRPARSVRHELRSSVFW